MESREFLLLVVVFTMWDNFSTAQTTPFSFPSDTLFFSTPLKGTEIESLNSVRGELMELSKQPVAFLNNYQHDSVIDFYVVVKTKSAFMLYPFIIGCSFSPVSSFIPPNEIVSASLLRKGYYKSVAMFCEKYQFKNAPDSFLIMRTSNYYGASKGCGYSIREDGFLLLNINTMQTLWLINHQRVENWPYGDGLLPTNTGTVRYMEYELLFEDGYLVTQIGSKKNRYVFESGLFVIKK